MNTKYIGKNDFYLNWDQVREMYDSGLVDFQMHTHSHAMTLKHLKVNWGFMMRKVLHILEEKVTVCFLMIFMRKILVVKKWMDCRFASQ